MEKAGVGVAVENDIKKIVGLIEKFLNTGVPFDIYPDDDVINRYTRRKQAERLLKIMTKED